MLLRRSSFVFLSLAFASMAPLGACTVSGPAILVDAGAAVDANPGAPVSPEGPSERPELDASTDAQDACHDGVKNGDELAVDCGGECAPCAGLAATCEECHVRGDDVFCAGSAGDAVKCKAKGPEGDACEASSDMDENPCLAGLVCKEGRCQLAARSSPCATGKFGCAGATTTCVARDGEPEGTCRQRLRRGATCESSAACDIGLFCNPINSRCEARSFAGRICFPERVLPDGSPRVYASSACAFGLSCKLLPKSECGVTSDCVPGRSCCTTFADRAEDTAAQCAVVADAFLCAAPFGVCTR